MVWSPVIVFLQLFFSEFFVVILSWYLRRIRLCHGLVLVTPHQPMCVFKKNRSFFLARHSSGTRSSDLKRSSNENGGKNYASQDRGTYIPRTTFCLLRRHFLTGRAPEVSG